MDNEFIDYEKFFDKKGYFSDLAENPWGLFKTQASLSPEQAAFYNTFYTPAGMLKEDAFLWVEDYIQHSDVDVVSDAVKMYMGCLFMYKMKGSLLDVCMFM